MKRTKPTPETKRTSNRFRARALVKQNNGGIPATPTALRLIKGGNQLSTINKNEAKPPLGVTRPEYLPESAQEVWNRLYPILDAVNLLTEADRGLFANYCILEGRMAENPDKFTINEMAQMRILGCSFGMTPAARATISVPQEDKKKEEKKSSIR